MLREAERTSGDEWSLGEFFQTLLRPLKACYPTSRLRVSRWHIRVHIFVGIHVVVVGVLDALVSGVGVRVFLTIVFVVVSMRGVMGVLVAHVAPSARVCRVVASRFRRGAIQSE